MRIRSFRFLEVIEQHGDGVGDFLASGEDGFFANDFRGKEALGLVGELVRRENRAALRAGASIQALTSSGAAFAGERGNREDLGEFEFPAVMVDQRAEAGASSRSQFCSAAERPGRGSA